MKLHIRVAGLLVVGLAFFAASPASAAVLNIKKYTDVITHSIYTEIYETSYRRFQTRISAPAFDYCNIRLEMYTLAKPGLVRKGEHYAAFVAKCYDDRVVDLNVAIYPYGEDTIAKLEIIFNDGSKKVIEQCWDDDAGGVPYDCKNSASYATLQPNFTRSQPPR